MAIIKDVTVKINNGTATLDAPVQFYEKDHDVELRFKLMDYKYKYDKDPQNILNSVDEDILEAYTTIVNPKGYELEQINGVVKNDTVIFRLDPTYTDELDELGTYKLQIHIKCTCSEFTIPPITFEVLQRLKGIKVVTDGEDEVDNSEILDNSSKFVSDETGKLIIEWKKGDMISSAKLNAMVDVINDAVDEETQRQLNEVEREQQELEREQQELERENRLQAALNSVDARVDESMNEYETRFNALTASQQQDMEVIDARDGEVSLKARLDRDIRNPLQVYEDVEGSYISCDSNEGYAQNVEILGNTLQDEDNLADIRSVGDEVEGQELYEIPVLSRGKNLNTGIEIGDLSEGVKANSTTNFRSKDFIRVRGGSNYTASIIGIDLVIQVYHQYDSNYNFISTAVKNSKLADNCRYIKITGRHNIAGTNIADIINNDIKIQLEEGTVATPYEPYQGDKLTILSPVQLEKVGDVADRIICKDGVWGVEKNIGNIVLDGSESWKISITNDIAVRFVLDNLTNVKYSEIIATIPTYMDGSSFGLSLITFGICSRDNNTGFNMHIEKTKINTVDVDGFKKWLKTNPVAIKYQLAQPQFIPLPYDQQIKLRTFANKTSISFLTEIEGAIKAQIPQSIGATINTHAEQIDNLNKELNRVTKLEESTASTVTTESSFISVENTNNGYFEDVKLEGKTLVNLATIIGKDDIGITLDKVNKTCTFRNPTSPGSVLFGFKYVKPNTVYTVIFEVLEITLPRINNDLFPDTFQELGVVHEAQIVKRSFRTPDDVSNLRGIRYYVHGANKGVCKLTFPIILEGDHTQNPPEYFEGIKSVGQDVDEMTIITTNAPMFFGKGGKK